MKRNIIKFKTYTLFAVDKITKDYNFILSVNANSLKAAREYAKPQILKLNRKYPHYHFDFEWEQDK